MVLSDVVRLLQLLRTDESQYMIPTIYAAEPWSASSEALVAWSPPRGGLPPEAAERHLLRLIDVQGAIDALRDCYFDLSNAGRYDELCGLLVQRILQRNSSR